MNDELKKLTESFHNNLVSTPGIIEIINAQYGFNLETIKKYQIGWTGINFRYGEIRYYQNCITIPVISSANVIRNIRFRPIKNDKISFEQVLNFKGISENVTFYSNLPDRPQKYWLFENELEIIRVTQSLTSDNLEKICVICPTSRRSGIPSEWCIPNFFGNCSLTIFFENSKAARDRARMVVQLLGDRVKVADLGSSRNVFELFNTLGDESTINYFLKLEESATGYAIKQTRIKQVLKSTLIEPNGVNPVKLINLNQDFLADAAYYTVGLERLTEYKIRKGGRTNYAMVKDVVPYVVTSNRVLAEIDDNIVNKLGITGRFMVCLPTSTPRWSLKSIRDFVQNGSCQEVDKIFDDTKNLFERNFIFKQPSDVFQIVLWIIGTYFYRLFPKFPILHIRSGSKEVQEKLAGFIECLVFNPWRFTETPRSILLSILCGYSPTILIEYLKLQSNTVGARTMRQILEKGTDTGISMLQMKKEKGQTRMVEAHVGCPKVIFSNTDVELPASTIRIEIQGCKEESQIPEQDFLFLRDHFYHFAMKYWQEIEKRIPDIDSRQGGGILVPLIAIAEIFGDELILYLQTAERSRNDITEVAVPSLEMKACLEVLQNNIGEENYSGFVYASDIAKSMQKLYPDRLSHLNWRNVLYCLRELGFTAERYGKRTNKGYKIKCPKAEVIQIVEKLGY